MSLIKLIQKYIRSFSKLNLTTKIYLSLAGILIPIFSLIIFIQIRITQPLLEEEVRQIGLSVCRSLGSDIISQSLLNRPDMLETRLIEITWQQPSFYSLTVFEKLPSKEMKVIASNLDDVQLPDAEQFDQLTSPVTHLENEDTNSYWEILYPVYNKANTRVLAYIKARVSLESVQTVTGIFFRITMIGAIVAIVLLIWTLSSYLKRTIENEKLLQVTQTENLQLSEQLHAMQQQLFLNEKLAIMGQLTASFAHEIGTPLNSLSGHLQLLDTELRASKDKERIDIIQSQVTRIEQIVKDFLASTHTPPRQLQIVDVPGVIERLIKLLLPQTQNLGIHILRDFESNLPPIRLVPSDLEQVLLNLANNAIDAMTDTSRTERHLKFSARHAQESSGQEILELSVSDTGEGMSESDLRNILKPFFTTKAPGKGTGLGLAISQGLVKKYYGKLTFESILGKGTTVTVRIPYEPA